MVSPAAAAVRSWCSAAERARDRTRRSARKPTDNRAVDDIAVGGISNDSASDNASKPYLVAPPDDAQPGFLVK